MCLELKPFDVVVFKGERYHISQQTVMLRSLSIYSHCIFMIDDKLNCLDPDLDGLKKQTINEYSGREAVVCRIKNQTHLLQVQDAMHTWLAGKFATAEGYDYLSWLGFATGLKKLQSENRWYCAELPYWCFMEHGFRLSYDEMTFVYPSYFPESLGSFDVVFDGVI